MPTVCVAAGSSRGRLALGQRFPWHEVGASDSPLSELPAKPDPAAMFAIAKVWGVPVGPGLVMVGDSPSNDVAFGKAAGVSTVLLDSSRKHEEGLGPNTPDLHVQSLAELPHLFAEHFRL